MESVDFGDYTTVPGGEYQQSMEYTTPQSMEYTTEYGIHRAGYGIHNRVRNTQQNTEYITEYGIHNIVWNAQHSTE